MIPTLIKDLGVIQLGNKRLSGGLYQCPVCLNNFTALQNDINTQRKRNCGCSTAYKEEQLPDEINGYKIIKDLRTINGRRTVLIQCPLCTTNTYSVPLTNLKLNKIKRHCGCKPKKVYIPKPKIDRPTPKYKHPMYYTWDNMIARCTRPSSPKYVNYGARGIKVCDRWMQSFNDFINDMGAKPTPLHSIERINNDGNYEPSNCKWATQKEQQNNKRPRKPKQK